MAKRQKKSARKSAKERKPAVTRALKQTHDLQAKAHEIHDHADALHAAAHATHETAHALKKTARKRRGGAPVKKLPPRGSVDDRVEPTERAGAPGTEDLEIVPTRPPALPFSVVGIGASAGGFEAVTDLVSALPKDLGMATILVQHLDPHHESRLADLLAHKSALPVKEIQNGVQVEPDTIYVLPSNAAVVLEGTRLRLIRREPAGNPMTIDFFFRSLAIEQQNRAVGIVLSGTGTDGTLGLAEIKGHGGVTFAQDKGTAKYFGMPGSAIAAGVIDFVLSPGSIASELKRLAAHPYLGPAKASPSPGSPSPGSPSPGSPSSLDMAPELVFKEHANEIKSMFLLLRTRTGVDFSLYKPATVNRRILRRMALLKIDELPLYVSHLQHHPEEVESLFNDLLISVTGFFRDAGFYQALKKRILPRLLKNRSQDAPVRVWSCGCATGEEAYSLAIVLAEYLDENNKYIPVQIFASDLNGKGIERARTGLYHENILIDVSPERLRRFFVKVDGYYQVSKQIREMCVFARQNVVLDPPFSNLDVISCRNVLIYLTPVLQRRIMPVFHYALKPGGYMLLGSSETTGEASELFELVDRKNKIYTKKTMSYRPSVDFSEKAFVLPRESQVLPKAPPPQERIEPLNATLQQRVDRLILNDFSPNGVVINAQLDVLQFRGKTGLFLEHQSGAASLNLLKMAREDLVLDLRRVVNKAIQTGEPARLETEMRLHGKVHGVTLQVHPLPRTSDVERFYLVLFHELSARARDATIADREDYRPKRGQPTRDQRQIGRLRDELAATKDSLQALIEDQDAINEELKSANEEIQSSNEELQSTNEELETAREELQSTNEELTTLNQELQTRNSELGQLNNDLTNLLSSVSIAIIMLGTDFKIRRFTPVAEKIFNLIPSDAGRKLSDLNRNIEVPDLDQAIEEVLDRLTVVDREVQDREGRWYSLRIRPYRTRESRIEGVVLVLTDIDDLKRAIKHIISIVHEPLVTLTTDLKVARVNDGFCRTFQIAPEHAEGKLIYELSDGTWNIPRVKQLLEEFLPAQGEVRDFRLEHEFPKVGKRNLVLNARRFYEENRGLQLILLAIKDVT